MTKFFGEYNNVEIWRDNSSKRSIYGAKKPIKIWNVNVEKIIISKLAETKTNSEYSIGYLDEVIRPLVLIFLSGYVKTFKVQDGNKDNKFMYFRIIDEKILEKYKAIWTKIEDLKNIKLNALPV